MYKAYLRTLEIFITLYVKLSLKIGNLVTYIEDIGDSIIDKIKSICNNLYSNEEVDLNG